MNKIIYAIVIYNKKITNSKTYQALQDYNIIIYDNSDQNSIQQFNADYAYNHHIKYLTMHQNVGLSKAYNQIINTIKHKNYDYIVLFDDDTVIDHFYLDALNNLPQPSNIVYTPIIKQNNIMINPRYTNKNFIIEAIKRLQYNNITKLKSLEGTNHLYAINSGLIIPMHFFDHFTYNEAIFLDCVDDYFCQQVYQQGYIIKILDVVLQHSFHMNELSNKSYDDLQTRVQGRFKDLKVYNNKHHFNYFIMKLAFIIQYIIRTKDIRFLKLIFV